MTTQAQITVGIVVERRKAASPWIDFTWQAVAVLPGQPDAEPWTVLSHDNECTSFYAGTTDIALYRTESRNYQDNLTSSQPSVWVALRPTDSDPPYRVLAATVDPAEGEAFTEAGNDLIEAVPMPSLIREAVTVFVAQNPAQQHFFKRKRERANPEALARRVPGREGDGR
jgi:hypothetical protein